MKPAPEVDDAVVERLVTHAVRWTGFSREAIRPSAVRAMTCARLSEGGTLDELLRAAAEGDAQIVHALREAVVVGETYFFRQPEHFALLEQHVRGRTAVRAWSAGCATGEEAYSMAASALACLGDDADVEVLGTDPLPQHVAAATAGVYGRWSQRRWTPMLHPVFARDDGERAVVAERLRRVTRFERHDVFDPPPGRFDVIFCRNVVLYFSEEGQQRACERLAEALAPGGLLVLGTLDVSAPPPGLVPFAAREVNAFVRAAPPPPRRERPRTVRPKSAMPRAPLKSTMPPPGSPEGAAVRQHLRALSLLERGDRRGAEGVLARVAAEHPSYLPALFEFALLQSASGGRARASELMREVLRRATLLPEEERLPGPRTLPAAFYVAGARAFLDRKALP